MNTSPTKTFTLRADLQAIADFIGPDSRVLDLGCSDGELLAFLVHQKRVQGRGIELSEAGVLACVRKGLSVRQGNINEGLADYPDQVFDYVILSQTLPYLNELEGVLGEMLRVGRQAIVSFPNWGYWRCRVEMLFTGRVPQAPDFEQKWHDARRWRLFTTADFADFCRLAKIQIEDELYLVSDKRVKGLWVNWRARTAVYTLTNGR